MENKKNKRKKWLSNQLKTKYQTNRESIIEMKKLKNRNYTNNEIKTCQMKIEKQKKSKYNKLKLLL